MFMFRRKYSNGIWKMDKDSIQMVNRGVGWFMTWLFVQYKLGTGEVLGSNPGKGENFWMKITISFILWQLGDLKHLILGNRVPE